MLKVRKSSSAANMTFEKYIEYYRKLFKEYGFSDEDIEVLLERKSLDYEGFILLNLVKPIFLSYNTIHYKGGGTVNAVIYARYSSDNQREESIEGQLRECIAFAESKGLTVIESYIDRAFSAKTDNRPEFQRMVKESIKRKFEVL